MPGHRRKGWSGGEMPPRTPDHIRAAILADLRLPEVPSTRVLAAKHGVSDGLVRKIADAAGLRPWTREQTENATRARAIDQAAQRAALAQDLLNDVHRLRERAWSEHEAWDRGEMGKLEKVTLELPPLSDVRQAYTSIGIVLDKHMALKRFDSDDGSSTAASLVRGLADAFGTAYELMTADGGEGGRPPAGPEHPQPEAAPLDR